VNNIEADCQNDQSVSHHCPEHKYSRLLRPTPQSPATRITTSLASFASLPMPTGVIDDNVKIASHDSSLGLLIAYCAALDFAIMKQRTFAFQVVVKVVASLHSCPPNSFCPWYLLSHSPTLDLYLLYTCIILAIIYCTLLSRGR
jgi:hypothetical protein